MQERVSIVFEHNNSGKKNVEAQEDDDDIANEDASCDGVIGCLPRVLDAAHRDELCGLVDALPQLVANREADCRALEASIARFSKLLLLYQEQPNLLDSMIPPMLRQLLGFVTLLSSDSCGLDALSNEGLAYIAHLCVVRGYKIIVRLLPHQVTYLEKLLLTLESFTSPVAADHPQRKVLLQWLWMVVRNPFDLKRFDAKGDAGKTLARIMHIAMPYLDERYSTCQSAAALVVAQCLTRSDGVELIGDVLATQLSRIRNGEPHQVLASLLVLLATLKHVDRVYLLGHVDAVVESIHSLYPFEDSLRGRLACKCLVKAAQRVAMVVLRPKVASWRYKRGKRRLDENLSGVQAKEHTKATNGDHNGTNGTSDDGRNNGVSVEVDADDFCLVEGDSEDDDDPHQLVEWALTQVLSALGNEDTSIRYSAAKGVGRICARLHKELAKQVVETILGANFDENSSYASWHGGCLALAELARRGLLLLEFLPKVFPIVEKALFYEEPMGKHQTGNQVRDAACYVLWAFARAYEPEEMTEYVRKIANGLMCAALFDREVNLRRAASAAFQENVGRQRNFPDGIALLTIADYFAVGNRQRSYTSVSVRVADFVDYRRPIVDHLISMKVTHWDECVRQQAALALEGLKQTLCSFDDGDRRQLLRRLVDGCATNNPVHRHGYLLATAHTLKGLLQSGVQVEKEVLSQVAEIPGQLAAESEKLRAPGALLTRKSLCQFLTTCAEAGIPLDAAQLDAWLQRVFAFARDDSERQTMRDLAATAGETIIGRYLSGCDSSTVEKLGTIQAQFVHVLRTTMRETERVGICMLSATIPVQHADDELFTTLCQIITKPAKHDLKWAMGRRFAVQAIHALFVGMVRLDLQEKWTTTCFEALYKGLDDYTNGAQGDIGRFVRQASMTAVAEILTTPGIATTSLDAFTLASTRNIIRQSAEKIGRTRECACKALMRLLESDLTRPRIADVLLLDGVYNDPLAFIQDGSISTLAPLFQCDEYFSDFIHGLVLSAGGIGEGTEKSGKFTLLEYQKSIANDSKKMEEFLSTIAEMLQDGMKVRRIGESILQILPQVLSHLGVFERSPDASRAVVKITTLLQKVAAVPTCPPIRSRMVLDALCALLTVDRRSNTWNSALTTVLRNLSSAVPTLRRATAEKLYEQLCCVDDVDDNVVRLLCETSWQDVDDVASAMQAAVDIEKLIRGDVAST